MFGKNSKMSTNVQKSRTPRQRTNNVEAGDEMKGCKNSQTSSASNKASNKTSGKSSTNAKNCK